MTSIDRFRGTPWLGIVLAAVVVACGGGGEGGTTPPPACVVQSVSVAPGTASLQAGRTLDLTIGIVQQNCASVAATWTSSSPNVASVSASGQVTGLAVGSTTITASAGGQSGSAVITVTAGPAFIVVITPANPTVAEKATLQLAASVRDSLGNAVTSTVTWTSANVATATVSSAGLVTGVKAGTTSITASASGRSATAPLAVTVPPVASVSVTPGPRTVDAGTTLLIEARPMDASGTAVAATATWTVSNPTVATVTATANNVASVEFRNVGSANVSATVDGKVAAVAITVVPRRPRFAYVYVHDSASTLPPQPFDTTDHSYNSAGGQVIVQRPQAGSWRLIFTGLRLDILSEPMLPLVRPIGVSTGQCATTARFTGQYNATYGDAYVVDVGCSGPTGNALTRPFMVVAFGSNYTTTPWAYTEVTDSTSAAIGNTYVPGGGTATAARQATDIYRVLLNPVQAGNEAWHPLSLSPRLTCGTVALAGAGLNRGVDLDCTLPNAARSRARTGLFVLLNGRAGQPRADAIVSEAGVVTATPSTTVPTVIKAPGVGVYRVRVSPPGLATTRYPAVIVTALRSAAPSTACRLIHLTTPINGTVEARVECRDGNATLRDNAFAISAIY